MKLFYRLLSLLLLSTMCLGGATAEGKSASYGAWIPYWDYIDAVDEIEMCDGQLDRLVAFAAIFDAQDQLLMLEPMEETVIYLQDMYGGKTDIYLSVVNDIELSPGEYDNKTSALVERLLADEKSETKHIEALIELCRKYQVDGLEIDYENIRVSQQLEEKYAAFIGRLWPAVQAAGFKMRVVLGWDDAGYTAYPEGPDYSVMCYNLYGNHSGPGPKADQDFLAQLYSLNKALPGDVTMAYATGGFDWKSDGGIESLTQLQAEDLLVECDFPASRMQRDVASGALHCTFTVDKITHEIWYADSQTLRGWRDQAIRMGYESFDLFRLAGNNDDDLTAFFTK